MGKNDQAYFTERAAEEMAAAERATCTAAASAHRELSLRYSLKIILPDSEGANDDAPIGQPRRLRQHQPTVAPRRRESKRSRG